ncbi:MAG TPA: universal stress protein [Streptosporangiaceae bacterium]|nr:universal stress protein [Streptosporangiaceae bacterium]
MAGTRAGTIVVSVDGTEAALRAWAYAAGVARRQNRRVVCVHVRSLMPVPAIPGTWDSFVDFTGEQLCAQLDAQKEVCAQIADDANAWGTNLHTVARIGHPMTELRKVLAEEANVDMVVVGSATKIGRRLALATGCRMLRRWPCLVVMVP